jgi:hypothetical protein
MPDITPEIDVTILRHDAKYANTDELRVSCTRAADTIDRLRARIAELEQQVASTGDSLVSVIVTAVELEQWKAAVIDAAVVGWTYKTEHENDPRAAINALLCHAQQIALDPCVSPEAKALHDRIAEFERVTRHLQHKARELCPDYPNIATCEDPFEHLWALTSAYEGTCLACEDLHKRIHELEELVSEAEARANERGRKMIECCFCNLQCASLETLKQHSAECPEHPLYPR